MRPFTLLDAFSALLWDQNGRPVARPAAAPPPPLPFPLPSPCSPADELQRRQAAEAMSRQDADRAAREAQFQQFIRDAAKRQLDAAEAAMQRPTISLPDLSPKG